MIAAVADTHTIIWYLYGDARLSTRAKNTIDDAISAGDTLLISAITCVEMVYLIEKERIAAESLTRLAAILNDPATVFEAYPVDLAIARTLSRIDREQIGDMPDRIIAATSLHLGVPVISRDAKISTPEITTIW
ncbi:MAG: type II toxin-antitoxin system VapC family toxin [Phototrophicaceae bacterium]